MKPLICEGEVGCDIDDWGVVFQDHFTDLSQWNIEDMADPLNRAGNDGIDDHGNLAPGQSPAGWRWSANYALHHDKTMVITPAGLEMRAYITETPNPLRPESYTTPDGVLIEPGKNTIYAGWLKSTKRIWNEAEKQHITDQNCPHNDFLYGFLEAELDFNRMDGEAGRFSWWLTPTKDKNGKDVRSNMYDKNPDETECDMIEVELSDRYPNHIVCKIVGGAAGDTKNHIIDCSLYGVDLRDGNTHTIGLYWDEKLLVWNLDGMEVNRDDERVMQVYMRMILSREYNSGVVGEHDGKLENSVMELPPYIPRDPGLFLGNIYLHLDKARESVLLVKRVTVWQRKGAAGGMPKKLRRSFSLRELPMLLTSFQALFTKIRDLIREFRARFGI